MSDSWHPSDGRADGTSPDAVPADTSRDSAPDQPQSAPQGGAIPLPPVGAPPAWQQQAQRHPHPTYPGGQYPTAPNPVVGPGSPTPPSGIWPTPPPHWGAVAPPVAPASGPWGGGGPGGTPPYGGWAYPGFTGPAPQPTTRKSRNGLVAALVAAVLLVAVLAGAGLGHAVWPSQSASSSSPNFTSPGSGSGSLGGGSSGSGSGSSPFGSGSPGSSSTGAGAPSDISAIANKVDPGLVDINTNLSYQDEQAAGTGMVLTSTGEILTNNHVIDGATSISVTDVGNGKTYTGNVVGYDRTGDVAVVQLVGASGLQTVTTDIGPTAVGQAVVGVGNAGGTGGTPSTAGGSITALDQSITASDDGGGNSENLNGLIEINAPIEPGDSGGSLVNTSSQVIGMDTAASQGSVVSGATSQAYAIPIGTALSIARQIEAGKASSTIHIGTTGFIGVSVVSSSANSSSSGGSYGGGFGSGSFGGGTGGSGSSSSTSGAVVQSVVSGSPAAQVGLSAGDVITGLNGNSVNSATDLSNLLESEHSGDTVQLQWTDESGQTHTATVKLAGGPPA
ncbi:MAG: trypsin-like peptidase domain-containing protein [Acidimicrobiales bacterium]